MKKYLLISFGIVLLFLVFFVWQYIIFSNRQLHIIFCNVGQGDAILIRTPEGKQILLDGGPDDTVLRCVSDHMPFWDRNIELIILSHPHADHLNGLISVLDRYEVDHFITEPLENKTEGYKALLALVARRHIKKQDVLAGDVMRIEPEVLLSVLGPTKQYLERTSPQGSIGESSEFGSLITKFSYRDFDVLFTGDSQVSGLNAALKGETFEVDVLHVPHHGSKYGLDKKLMEGIDPKLSVISVGRKNRYGHPAPFILTLLQNHRVKYFRTDQDGDIEIVSDGKKFWVMD